MFKAIAAVSTLLILGVLPAAAEAAGRVNSFIYHRFNESRYPSTNISAEIFQAQLRYLTDQRLRVLTHGEIARRLSAGEPLPEQAVALSVDDAFSSFAEVAMPILRQAGLPVTLFVNTDAVGTPGYLDWKQLQALHEEGVEIGNHSATHDYLVELKTGESFAQWRERVRNDILKAQEAFEQHLGIQPTIFAYPFGEYIPELVAIVEELGFLAAFAQQSGVIHSAQNRFFLPRFPMGGPFATLDGFISKLAMEPIIVAEERPLSPLLGATNPPELQLKIEDSGVDLRLINCFVQSDNSCKAEPIADRRGWFRVTAERPLTGRRNKYTLTARGKTGGWHWYSHLWLKAVSPVVPAPKSVLDSAAQAQTDAGKAAQRVLANQ
jgi:peptidoglycan/xylan/chitin deacetylase (PgdA/CDA1 family)